MLVNFVLILTILLGCCGLALDIGLLQLKRLQMQNAADAAAMGAVMEFERGDSAGAATAGYADAALNGFTNGVNGVSISYTYPPATTAFSTNQSAIQAIIQQPVVTLLMGKTITVQAQATALIPPCGYMMSTSLLYADLWLQSAGIEPTCPLYMAQNYTIDYFGKDTAYANYVAGIAGSSGGGGSVSSPAIFNYPSMADPLSYITSPSFTGCTYIGLPNILLPTTLNPGTYCNLPGLPGLTILAATVTFNPGLYIITGGIYTNGATLNGSNVTFFMTKRTDLLAIPAYGQVSFNSTTLNLTAPVDNSNGGVPGVLIFGDRNWVPTSSDDIIIQSCSSNSDGIIYFQKAGIYEYNSNLVTPHYFGLVVDNVHEFFGNIHLGTNYSFVQGGNPFRPRESLAE